MMSSFIKCMITNPTVIIGVVTLCFPSFSKIFFRTFDMYVDNKSQNRWIKSTWQAKPRARNFRNATPTRGRQKLAVHPNLTSQQGCLLDSSWFGLVRGASTEIGYSPLRLGKQAAYTSAWQRGRACWPSMSISLCVWYSHRGLKITGKHLYSRKILWHIFYLG